MSDSEIESALTKLQFEIADIKKTLEFQKDTFLGQRDYQKDQLTLQKDFSTLVTQVKVDSNFYKWIGSTGLFVAILLGALGIYRYTDLIDQMRNKVDQAAEYQFNLARGLALANGKRPLDAAEYLQKCFDQTPTDETVALTLLSSYHSGDEWNKSVVVATRVRKRLGFEKIRDPWLLNNMAVAFLYQGRDDAEVLSQAGQYLTRAASELHGDSDERSVWLNSWVYDLYKGDRQKAVQDLENAYSAKSVQLDKAVWDKCDWENQAKWSLFDHLAQKNENVKHQAQATISEMLKKHKATGGECAAT
jgi:tetratricopeptide (TPR) repeat protein